MARKAEVQHEDQEDGMSMNMDMTSPIIDVSSVPVDCFLQEEKESKDYTPAELLQLFKDCVEQLHTLLDVILKSKTDSDEEADPNFDMTDVVVLLMEMKRFNRLNLHCMKRSADNTSKHQQQLDALTLEFQNLLHEKMYLEKKIDNCHKYRLNTDDLDLVPVEEFYKNVMQEEMAEDDQELAIQRLQHEVQLRKKLSDDLYDAHIEKQKYKKRIKTMKEEIGNIDLTLETILKTTTPLYERLNFQFLESDVKHKNAKYLATPLYCLYRHTSMCCQLFDKQITVSVVGNVAEAKKFMVKLNKSDETDDEIPMENEDQKKEGEEKEVEKKEGEQKEKDGEKKEKEGEKKEKEGEKKEKEGEKKEKEGEKKEKEGEKKEKEGEKKEKEGEKKERDEEKKEKEEERIEQEREDKEKEEKAQEETEEEIRKLAHQKRRAAAKCKDDDIYHKHPLLVHMIIEDKELRIHLEFAYLYRLNFVTVQVKSISTDLPSSPAIDHIMDLDTIFSCLFPGDNGKQLRNPIEDRAIDENQNKTKMSHDTTGLPYIWAQKMGGLHFMPSDNRKRADGKRSFQIRTFLEQSTEALKSRLKVRVILNSQIRSIVPGLQVSPGQAPYYPPLVHSHLKEWSLATWEEAVVYPDYKKLFSTNVINKDAMLYKAVITRESATLTALIALFPDYPTRSPFFLLSLEWEAHDVAFSNLVLKELGKEVNLYCVENVSEKGKNSLLICQLHHLRACFDVFFEMEMLKIDNKESQKSPCQVADICRGPGRNRPYQFVSSNRTFYKK